MSAPAETWRRAWGWPSGRGEWTLVLALLGSVFAGHALLGAAPAVGAAVVGGLWWRR